MKALTAFTSLKFHLPSQLRTFTVSAVNKAATEPPPTPKHDIMNPKTGILMLNMGGPQTTGEVGEYLLRIMTDKDMIQLPFQDVLGPFIAKRRTSSVQQKYSEIGGGSPILKWTRLQGYNLCKKLDAISPSTAPHKPYVAFRYANPLTEVALSELKADGVQHTIVFSQYPQYSCATTGSSFNAIYTHYQKNDLPQGMSWSIIDRWGNNKKLAEVFAKNILKELESFPQDVRSKVVLLFSAHSLPSKAVFRGDPYPYEVGATVQGVMDQLNHSMPYSLVWQSKVGPVEWLQPFTDDAIKEYVKKGFTNFILVPIAFVNEHIETLHELDIEYCEDLRREVGEHVTIRRAKAPNDHPLFIEAMAEVVKSHIDKGFGVSPKFLLRCPSCENIRCHDAKKWWANTCGSNVKSAQKSIA